jgi:hypothetical protein
MIHDKLQNPTILWSGRVGLSGIFFSSVDGMLTGKRRRPKHRHYE